MLHTGVQHVSFLSINGNSDKQTRCQTVPGRMLHSRHPASATLRQLDHCSWKRTSIPFQPSLNRKSIAVFGAKSTIICQRSENPSCSGGSWRTHHVLPKFSYRSLTKKKDKTRARSSRSVGVVVAILEAVAVGSAGSANTIGCQGLRGHWWPLSDRRRCRFVQQ